MNREKLHGKVLGRGTPNVCRSMYQGLRMACSSLETKEYKMMTMQTTTGGCAEPAGMGRTVL